MGMQSVRCYVWSYNVSPNVHSHSFACEFPDFFFFFKPFAGEIVLSLFCVLATFVEITFLYVHVSFLF